MKKTKRLGVGRAVFLLLFAVILSIYAVSYYYAKYAGGANPGDSARVAAFSVSALGGSDSITVDSTTAPYSSDYSFSVTSDSEVAVRYDIIVSFAQTIPSWITLKLDGNVGVQSGSSATFTNAGAFTAGTDTNVHTLTFQSDPSTQNGQSSFTGINVRVDAVQID